VTVIKHHFHTANPSNASDPQATTKLKFAKVLVASQKACAAQYAALNASSVYLLGNSMLCSNVSATKTSSCQVKKIASDYLCGAVALK